jgi:hypothetical protein
VHQLNAQNRLTDYGLRYIPNAEKGWSRRIYFYEAELLLPKIQRDRPT